MVLCQAGQGLATASRLVGAVSPEETQAWLFCTHPTAQSSCWWSGTCAHSSGKFSLPRSCTMGKAGSRLITKEIQKPNLYMHIYHIYHIVLLAYCHKISIYNIKDYYIIILLYVNYTPELHTASPPYPRVLYPHYLTHLKNVLLPKCPTQVDLR